MKAVMSAKVTGENCDQYSGMKLLVKIARKGFVLLNPRIKVGYDSDDFVYNRLTLVTTYDAYKAPRIVTKKLKQWM